VDIFEIVGVGVLQLPKRVIVFGDRETRRRVDAVDLLDGRPNPRGLGILVDVDSPFELGTCLAPVDFVTVS